VPERALRALREGVELDDGVTAPARVRRLGPSALELTIHEGRNRQVKRMCERVGHPVRLLRRVRFGPLELGRLQEGEHRRLSAAEVDRLRAASAGSAARRGAGASS
jgi:23S rRNA pseudouridine2605 synthase